jgi:hypothetical protein
MEDRTGAYIYLKSILCSYSSLHEDRPHQDNGKVVYGGADLVTPLACGHETLDSALWTVRWK